MTQVILQLTGKRKQALLESNLPGISCSTGMVKESVGKHQPLFLWIIPRVGCLKKLNQKNSVSSAVLYFYMALFSGELTPLSFGEGKVPTLYRLKSQYGVRSPGKIPMRAKNTAIINALTAVSNTRTNRDKLLYGKLTGVVDVAMDVKNYVKSVFGAKSPQYKQVSGLRFTRPGGD